MKELDSFYLTLFAALVLAITLLFVRHVAAQQAQPYVPFSVTEVEYNNLMRYLLTQPMGSVESVVSWMRQKEEEAQREAKKKEKPDAK
jgi:hypothetical protein